MPEYICPFYKSIEIDWGIQTPKRNCPLCLRWDVTQNKCSIEEKILKIETYEQDKEIVK